MAKQALCIKSIDNLFKAANENLDFTIDAMLVDSEIYEKPENEYLPIIPYVIFYNINSETGYAKFVYYKRASNITEKSLSSKTSIGFECYIDSKDDIDIDIDSIDNGIINYKLNIEQLINIIISTSKQKLIKKLGEKLLNAINFDDKIPNKLPEVAFFKYDSNIENNKIDIGPCVGIFLNKEQFDLFFKEAVINKDEIDEIGTLSVNLGAILEEFDITHKLDNITNDLNKNYNLEDRSSMIFYNICRGFLIYFRSKITYKELSSLVKFEIEKTYSKEKPTEEIIQFIK